MLNLRIKQLITLTATATLFLCQNALASTAMDSIGTGSSGSYSHGAPKAEGSKGKKTIPHHISGSKGHSKSEGSGSKSYSHQGKSRGHSYSHKKPEGSGHHAKSGHGYNKGHKSGHSYKKGHKGHGGHTGKCPFTHLLRFKDKLGLTEAQVAEVKRLRFEYGKQSVRNKAEHKIAHMEYDRVVHAAKVDEQAIRSAARKIADTKTQKIMAKAEAKIALLNLLTDEQRAKAHKMHSAH
jgi:Spy/CpxP family protein refolding chaperone